MFAKVRREESRRKVMLTQHTDSIVDPQNSALATSKRRILFQGIKGRISNGMTTVINHTTQGKHAGRFMANQQTLSHEIREKQPD